MSKLRSVVVLFLLLVSCGNQKGQFAFQTPEDKGYRINQSRFEYDSVKEINWIYKFGFTPGDRINIGVILLKKELGWIDILTVSDYIDPVKNIIYGTLKELEPGDYKIVLVEITPDGNKTIDEIEVYLYSDEETLD